MAQTTQKVLHNLIRYGRARLLAGCDWSLFSRLSPVAFSGGSGGITGALFEDACSGELYAIPEPGSELRFCTASQNPVRIRPGSGFLPFQITAPTLKHFQNSHTIGRLPVSPGGRPSRKEIIMQNEAIIASFGPYSPYQYSRPWAAVVADGKLHFLQNALYEGRRGGMLVIRKPESGRLYAFGQKDRHDSGFSVSVRAVWDGGRFILTDRNGKPAEFHPNTGNLIFHDGPQDEDIPGLIRWCTAPAFTHEPGQYVRGKQKQGA